MSIFLSPQDHPMHLRALSLHHFRRFTSIQWEGFQQINLFSGKNGSGKTSVLEALAILMTGRSFRAHSNEVAIGHSYSTFTIHSEWSAPHDQMSLGVEYSRSKGLKIVKNSEIWTKARQERQKHPIRLFTPENIHLLSQGHEARLNFLNWSCFYLIPEFRKLWMIFLRLLHHRRILLKERTPLAELHLWDGQLCAFNEKIEIARSQQLQQLHHYWQEHLPRYFSRYPIEISFSSGWDPSSSYAEQLKESYSWDCRHHSTRFGVHRADFSLKAHQFPATQLLSRGEMKALILSLGLLQLEWVHQQSGHMPIALIDEFDAELDEVHQNALKEALNASSAQIFITSLHRVQGGESWKCLDL